MLCTEMDLSHTAREVYWKMFFFWKGYNFFFNVKHHCFEILKCYTQYIENKAFSSLVLELHSSSYF